MKVALNKCFGGFRLSAKVIEMLGGIDKTLEMTFGLDEDRILTGIRDFRANPKLIEVIEKLGADANPPGVPSTRLEVVEIPDTVTDWEIDESDGWETLTYVVKGKLYHA